MIDDDAPNAGFAKGLLTAMILLGAFIGAINQGWIADLISRKRSISLAVAIFTVGSIFQTASMTYDMLVFSRFVAGIGIGMLAMVVPLYISEISAPEIRGTLLVLEEFSIVFGIVVAFFLSYISRNINSEWSWRLPFLIQIIPGLILGIGILFLPFSPRWLASKERYHEGLAELARLRQLPATDPRVRREWIDIKAEAILCKQTEEERHPNLQGRTMISTITVGFAGWADCFKPWCWKRTQVGIGLMFFQQMVGINAIIYYAPLLLKTLGLDYELQLIITGVLNIFQLIGVISSFWTMDRMGRRTLLIYGALAMTVCHLLVAIMVGKYNKDWSAHKGGAWISVVSLLAYMLFFGASWGPVPWAMPAEIFPLSLRAKGVALSTCSNWFNNFIVGLITPPLVIKTGYGAYIFFMIFCGLGAAWVWFVVPETMGRTLEEMDHVFQDDTGLRDEAKREQIKRELEAEENETGL
jgi:sugar porter (SP) family MFS transporter